MPPFPLVCSCKRHYVINKNEKIKGKILNKKYKKKCDLEALQSEGLLRERGVYLRTVVQLTQRNKFLTLSNSVTEARLTM